MASPAEPLFPVVSPADKSWVERLQVPHILYWGIHVACLLGLFVEATTTSLCLFVGTLALRMFGITGGYHRYFSHRTYKTSRVFQFLLGFLGTTAVQKGPLWWAAGHRRHHKYSDQPGDMHSPRDGFLYSHFGWIFDDRWYPTQLNLIRDLARYPELAWLDRYHAVPPVLLALFCLAVGGLSGLVWGFVISTVALWHITYSINSLSHVWGSRRYETTDDSRNNWLLALLTMGEGWHNNHHHYMSCARQGFFWWEIDVTYYVLRCLAALGIIWDIREPPGHVLTRGHASSGGD